ncbi:DUF559 domain-containing protein [Microbacterium sp.]|uniref:DUF559 domain-containing protein n=1 Tax=Microbacterium sp. TaxID=51671 RepID=UPI003A84841F
MSRRGISELVAAVAGGVARASSLQRAGHSRHYIAEAVRHGELVRVRRDWVAAPGADAELVAAARYGVVITCVSAARRAGLWVLGEDTRHVAVRKGSGGGWPAQLHVHWAAPLVPRAPDELVDRIENTLALVAGCQPFEEALAVWDSAIRQGAVSRETLERLTLSGAARDLLDEVSPFADSGLETFFRTRLRWLRVRILSQIWLHGHRVDFLIGDRLVVQIDGGHHVGAQRAADIAHDAELVLRGYTVLRYTYAQIVDDWPAVQDAIQQAVAQGLHRAA